MKGFCMSFAALDEHERPRKVALTFWSGEGSMRTVLVAALGALTLGACAQQEAAQLSGQALIERGEYLVNGVVLCGDCHTPRLENMAPDESRPLQGSALAPMGPPEVFATIAPPIAGLPANYSEEQFISFLQTGVRPDGSHPRPPMPPYRLNEADARAVAAYIGSLQRGEEGASPPTSP
jgi:mono/diheme cytochrome c family protein